MRPSHRSHKAACRSPPRKVSSTMWSPQSMLLMISPHTAAFTSTSSSLSPAHGPNPGCSLISKTTLLFYALMYVLLWLPLILIVTDFADVGLPSVLGVDDLPHYWPHRAAMGYTAACAAEGAACFPLHCGTRIGAGENAQCCAHWECRCYRNHFDGSPLRRTLSCGSWLPDVS